MVSQFSTLTEESLKPKWWQWNCLSMKRVKGTEEGQDWKARALLPIPLEEPATSSLITWSHHRDGTSTSDGGTEVDFDVPAFLLRSYTGSGVTHTTLLCKRTYMIHGEKLEEWPPRKGSRVAPPWLVPTVAWSPPPRYLAAGSLMSAAILP